MHTTQLAHGKINNSDHRHRLGAFAGGMTKPREPETLSGPWSVYS
jgi:hypothetical protein